VRRRGGGAGRGGAWGPVPPGRAPAAGGWGGPGRGGGHAGAGAAGGRRADETVDRWRGRPRRPIWAWVLGAAVITGIAIAAASLVMSWNRNRGEPWRDDALEGSDRISETGSLAGPDLGASADLPVTRRSKTGLTAAEGSLLSYDPVEGRDA
jgi:hypothetical protein